jgi:putative glycosyltransferase (TIGR04348 family)
VILRTIGEPLPEADVLIALHARRCHDALRAWRDAAPTKPAVLVLTGTDLYRDVPAGDAAAMESLALAHRLVVLQHRGIAALPHAVRSKASVVYQSAAPLPPFAKSARRLRACFAGHLRPEKDPFTYLRAAVSLHARRDIAFELIGGLREPAMAAETEALLAQAPNVKPLGALPYRSTRQHIRRAHVLVVPSRMEGGANVIAEAIVSGTPVIASDCDGNVGMLGEDYPGYFPVGDVAALTAQLARCRDERAYLDTLNRMCAARAPRFTAEAERQSLLSVLAGCGIGA